MDWFGVEHCLEWCGLDTVWDWSGLVAAMGKCKYNPEWEKEFLWIKSVDNDRNRGWCKPCQISISVLKGRGDILKHGSSKSHLKKEQSDKAPNPITNKLTSKQLSIGDSLMKQKEIQSKQRESKDAALKFEFGLTVRAATRAIYLSI